MIEELTAEETAQLEEGQYRWKVYRERPLFLLKLTLQRKGWIFWYDVDRGTRYPEFHDEYRYTSTEEYRTRIEHFKTEIIASVNYHQAADKADKEFFGNA